MSKKLYISYGSNLNKAQMRFRCPNAKVVAKSWLHDYRLTFQGSRYNAHANVIPEKGQAVPVAIWEIGPRDEANLDRYEGVAGGYYTKKYITLEVAGEMREALIYIMTPNDYGIPADSYLDTIAQGYKDFNFPALTLNEAVIHAGKHTRRLRSAT